VLSKDLERVIEQVNKLKEENKHLLRRAEGAESEAREKEHHMKKEVSELKVLVVKLEGHIEEHNQQIRGTQGQIKDLEKENRALKRLNNIAN
jgi:chromosome segregation ATPase